MGPQARIGELTLEGQDPGFAERRVSQESEAEEGAQSESGDGEHGLSRLRTQYQKKDRLEATAALKTQTYDPPRSV